MAKTSRKTTFRTTVELGGKTATGFAVPAEVVEGLGSHKRPPVRVTIGKHTYGSTVAVMGGRFLLPLSAENREAAGVAAGDEVDVSIELDEKTAPGAEGAGDTTPGGAEAPREVKVPADLAKALARNAKAKASFEKLSYSHKRQHVLAIEDAKKPETRQRRIEKTLEMLQQGGR